MEMNEALADLLNVGVDEVEDRGSSAYGHGESFSVNGMDYDGFASEEDAKQEAMEDCINLWETDVGPMECINWNNMPNSLEHYVDTDAFDEDMHEYNRSYAEDIASESDSTGEYENRLQEEMVERGLNYTGDIDTDAETMADDMDSDWDSSVQYIIDNFGKEEFDRIIKEHPELIDLQKLAEDIVNLDGAANTLARYDGEEVEYQGFYFYRNN